MALRPYCILSAVRINMECGFIRMTNHLKTEIMTRLELDGWIVKEGNDMENKLFFYSEKPERHSYDEFCASDGGDNVFVIDLPIKMFVATNEPQRCKITVQLER